MVSLVLDAPGRVDLQAGVVLLRAVGGDEVGAGQEAVAVPSTANAF